MEPLNLSQEGNLHLELRARDSHSQPGMVSLRYRLLMPKLDLGLEFQVYLAKEALPDKDVESSLLAGGWVMARDTLTAIIRKPHGVIPASAIQAPAPASPSGEVEKLKKELADLQSAYDALLLGKLGILGGSHA